MVAQDLPFSGRERVNLLNVFLDIIPPEDLLEFTLKYINSPVDNSPPGKNIVLLSLWDLLRARRNHQYRRFVHNAALVIPISKSLLSGARFLKGIAPVRYMPFHFIVELLSILESREYTVYLLGGKDDVLKKAEKNIRLTFPRLRIIGRCAASFRKHDEGAIVEAIRKTAPQLLLVGRGVRGGEMWIARNDERLNRGLRLWCSDLFNVFAKKRRRPSDRVFNLGLEAFFYCFHNPLKFFRFFSYLRYKILLLFYKLSR